MLVISSAWAQSQIGTTYYVSTSGDDGNSGSIDAPYRTIQHAAQLTAPGDVVLVREGKYFEDRIEITVSGTPDHPIVFQNYPGETPVIDLGLQVNAAWTQLDGSPSIFRVKPDYGPSSHNHWATTTLKVVVNGKVLIPAKNCSPDIVATCVSAGTFWVDTSSGSGSGSGSGSNYGVTYVNPDDGSNPNTGDVTILNSNGIGGSAYETRIQSFSGLDHNVVASNIVLDGFVIQGGENGVLIADPAGTNLHTNFTVRNCEIRFVQSYAIRWTNWDTSLVDSVSVHDNGLINFPRGTAPGTGWPTVIIGYGATNITVQNSDIHDNHGEGVGPYLGCSFWTIRGNTVYDNYSVNIYDDTDGNGAGEGDISIDGNLIYNTGKYSGASDIRNRPIGIAIANERADFASSYALNPCQSNVSVTNNIVSGSGKNGIQVMNYQRGPFCLLNSTIANNTVTAGYVSGTSAAIAINVGVAENVTVANNLAYPDAIVLSGLNTANPYSNGKGIQAENNLTAVPALFRASGGAYPVSVSQLVYGNPLFCGDPNVAVAANVALSAGSPALASGCDSCRSSPNLLKDFFSNPRPQGTASNIGAIEGGCRR